MNDRVIDPETNCTCELKHGIDSTLYLSEYRFASAIVINTTRSLVRLASDVLTKHEAHGAENKQSTSLRFSAPRWL